MRGCHPARAARPGTMLPPADVSPSSEIPVQAVLRFASLAGSAGNLLWVWSHHLAEFPVSHGDYDTYLGPTWVNSTSSLLRTHYPARNCNITCWKGKHKY